MAKVLAFVPDLLFGSNVLGALRAAGHDTSLVGDLESADLSTTDVLVVDLTADVQDRIALVQRADLGPGARVLAFYSHVEAEVRALAQEAGFDRIVPRSRMAREGAELVTALAAEK